MSLQTQFENMVAQRPSPNVPQMNPNSSDLTRGLQVATFAMDTIGQVVRSERQSEAQQYQQKAQQAMQNAYQQTGSMQKAVLSANQVAQNVPAWARESVAASMSEFLGVFRMAQENDAIAQEARARKQQISAQAIDAEDEGLVRWVSELEGDEELLATTQKQFAMQMYNNQLDKGQTRLSTAQFNEMLDAELRDQENPNNVLLGFYESATSMPIPELATESRALGVDNRARTAKAFGSETTRLQDLTAQMAETTNQTRLDELALQSQTAVDGILSLSNQVQADLLTEARGQVKAGVNRQQQYNTTATELRVLAAAMTNYTAMNLPAEQSEQFENRAKSLGEVADILENQQQLDITRLEREVRTLEAQARLGNKELTASKALLGAQGFSEAIGAVSTGRADPQGEIAVRVKDWVVTAFGEEVSAVEAAQTFEAASSRFLSGNATEDDYNLISVGALDSFTQIVADDQITSEELEEIQENLLPLMFSSTILNTDTVTGRANAASAYEMLAPYINADELDDETREIWTTFKGNAVISKGLGDELPISNAILAFTPQDKAFTSGRGDTTESPMDYEGEYNDWVVNEWDDIKESLEGTIYGQAIETPRGYLSFLAQMNNNNLDGVDEDFIREGQNVLERLVSAQREQGDGAIEEHTEVLDQRLDDIVSERLARNKQFFGISARDITTAVPVQRNGVTSTVNYIDLDKFYEKLGVPTTAQQEQPSVETPTPVETPTEVETPPDMEEPEAEPEVETPQASEEPEVAEETAGEGTSTSRYDNMNDEAKQAIIDAYLLNPDSFTDEELLAKIGEWNAERDSQ